MTAVKNARIWLVTFSTITGLGWLSTEAISINVSGVITPAKPLLKALDGFSITMDSYLPTIDGVVVLSNEPSSLGLHSRLSDMLTDQHSTNLYKKRFAIYYYDYAVSDSRDIVALNTDLTLLGDFQAEEFTVVEDTLSITCTKTIIDNIPVTRRLPEIGDFADAPSGAAGQFLPLVFGNTIVPLVPATADYKYWGIATVRNDAPLSAITKFRCKDPIFGDYLDVSPASSNTRTYWNEATSGGTIGYDAFGYVPRAFLLGSFYLSVSDNRLKSTILTSVKIPVNFIVASPQGEITVSIMKVPPGTAGSTVLATGRAKLIDQFSGTGSKNIEIFFDKPVLHDGVTEHYISVSTANVSALAQWSIIGYTGGVVSGFYQDASSKVWYRTNLDPIIFDCYGPYYTTYLSYNSWTGPLGTVGALDSDGNGVAMLKLEQRAALSGQTQTSLASLELHAFVSGITDNAGGTITGVAGTVLREGRHILKYLSTSYGAQILSILNSTTALTTIEKDSTISLDGALEGNIYLKEAIEEVCRHVKARFNYTTLSGASVSYPSFYGFAKTASFVITNDNSRLVSITQLGQESIVNKFTLEYSGNSGTSNNRSPFAKPALTLEWYSTRNYLTKSHSELSATKYGNKYLGKDIYPLLGSKDDANRLSVKIASRNPFPTLLAKFEVALEEFKDLKVLDLVEVLHSEIPYSFGGSTRGAILTYNSNEVDLTKGRPWRKAKRYRAEVEAIELIFNSESIARLLLTLRLITSPTDPT